jgi:hypothetical protein
MKTEQMKNEEVRMKNRRTAVLRLFLCFILHSEFFIPTESPRSLRGGLAKWMVGRLV